MSLDFKRILCPADLSTFSLEAVKLAVKVAENSGTTLYMLHLIDSPFDDLYMSSITEADPALLEMYQNEPARGFAQNCCTLGDLIEAILPPVGGEPAQGQISCFNRQRF